MSTTPFTREELDALAAEVGKGWDTTREEERRLIATARAGLADTERLEELEAWGDVLGWIHPDIDHAPDDRLLEINWVVGDGSGEECITRGKTFREAIDAFVSMRSAPPPPSSGEPTPEDADWLTNQLYEYGNEAPERHEVLAILQAYEKRRASRVLPQGEGR